MMVRNQLCPLINPLLLYQIYNFSPQKVCTKLSKLKVSFSSTPDEIPGFILWNLSYTFRIPLRLLYQHFFQYNYLPSTWKTAYIVPIYTKGDPSKYDNYRPISLTPIPCVKSWNLLFGTIWLHISRAIIYTTFYSIIVNKASINFILLIQNF